jgi:hypothetical protein
MPVRSDGLMAKHRSNAELAETMRPSWSRPTTTSPLASTQSRSAASATGGVMEATLA